MRALGAIALLACRLALADDTLSVVKDAKTPPLMNALNLIAEGAGYYKDAGLKVTTILTNGAPEARVVCSERAE